MHEAPRLCITNDLHSNDCWASLATQNALSTSPVHEKDGERMTGLANWNARMTVPAHGNYSNAQEMHVLQKNKLHET